MKQCISCLSHKPLLEFYAHNKSSDGLYGSCKDCKKKYEKDNKNYLVYDKTEKGVIRVIYKTQKSNSKRRGHNPPTYTKQELRVWLYNNGYKKLHDAWSNSGYDKQLKPSVDRLDDFKPYSIDNIRLVTWKENKDKQTDDILFGRSTSGLRCKPVLQFDLGGNFIKEYVSYSSATRSTGIKNIDRACLGARKSAGGFKWEYKYG